MRACRLFGHSRQAYYQSKADIASEIEHERSVIAAVAQIREQDPHLGGYKLWLMLINMFGRDFVPGRDRFLQTLRRKGLMLPKPKPRCTTNSNHRYHKWKNRIRGFSPSSANQLWVADITYIALAGGDVAYLHLITDAYSHKIVGWTLSNSLKSVHTIQALRMAIDQAGDASGSTSLPGLIHHSDRGVQYCCDAYVAILKEHDITISMTEDYCPTDNAIAERTNGIIKTECIYRQKQLPSYEQARTLISDFINFYNSARPHLSIGAKTPEMVHQEHGEQKRMWKSKIYRKKKDINEENMLPLPAASCSEPAGSEHEAPHGERKRR
nr:unnamed protein product [uncultured bacterium]